ncbi:MAG TPA: hypothetical protein VH601_25935 [Bryobacteraceae bacterium]|jgi:hypothetical protein
MKRLSLGLRFRSQRAERNKLPFGIPANIRLAQISGVSVIDRAVTFAPDDWHNIERFRPRILVGHAGSLKRLSEQVHRGILNLDSVNHAVFVLTTCGESPLSDTLRVLLWQSFGVPVYEVVVAGDGTLLATDCEAEEGWHLQPGVHARLIGRELHFEMPGVRALCTGLAAVINSEPCACGRSTFRINGMERLRGPAAVQGLAATA